MSTDLDRAMAAFQRCVEQRDRHSAELILDDDFALVLVAPRYAVMPRARWLDVLPDYVVHDYVVEEQVVDVDEDEDEDGGCAVVLHRVRMSATVLGDDRSGPFVITDVWRRRDSGWRLWRRHSTPLAAGPIPGVG